jgi:membrane protein YdbS with pleckstrin-like domain
MKQILSILLVVIIGILVYGYYVKSNGDANGEIIIGVGVLIIAFIFMPLFIYHRYKNKNIKDFTFDKYRKDLEEHNKKNNS